MSDYKGVDPEQRFLGIIAGLERRIDELSRSQLFVPIVDSDPATDANVGNIWGFNDGRLRMRLPSGSIVEYRPTSTPSIPILAADPASSTGINIWLLNTNGHLRVRKADNSAIFDYAPSSAASGGGTSTGAGGTSTSIPKPSAPVLKRTRSMVLPATWTQSYAGSGSQHDAGLLYYGTGDAYNGRQVSLIGFADTITSGLSGASVVGVEVYLRNMGSGYDNGSTVYLGVHNNTTKPTTLAGLTHSRIKQSFFNTGQDQWVSLPSAAYGYFTDGSAKGIVLQAPNDSKDYYGWMAGMGLQGAPQLRITYIK